MTGAGKAVRSPSDGAAPGSSTKAMNAAAIRARWGQLRSASRYVLARPPTVTTYEAPWSATDVPVEGATAPADGSSDPKTVSTACCVGQAPSTAMAGPPSGSCAADGRAASAMVAPAIQSSPCRGAVRPEPLRGLSRGRRAPGRMASEPIAIRPHHGTRMELPSTTGRANRASGRNPSRLSPGATKLGDHPTRRRAAREHKERPPSRPSRTPLVRFGGSISAHGFTS